MNYKKALAVLFVILSIGSVQETVRIFTSMNQDIAENRSGLKIMAFTMTLLFVFLAVYFWNKSKQRKY